MLSLITLGFRTFLAHTVLVYQPAFRNVRLTILLSALTLLGVGCPGRSPVTEQPLPPGGPYRSDDGGVNFVQKARAAIEGGLTGVTPIEVTIDSFDPNTIYVAGGASGLFVTRNAGDSWELVDTPTFSVTSIVLHPRNPNILSIAGAAEESPDRSRIWKSYDRGETWEELYAEPLGGRTVEGGIFQFRRVSKPVVMSLAVHPKSPQLVYAGSSSGALVVSRDGGTTWSTQHTFPQGLSGIKLSPSAPERIFVRLEDGTLGRSDDAGVSAKALDIRAGKTRALFIHAVFLAPNEPNTILVGTDRGIFSSTDAGDTWNVVPLPVSENELVRVSAIARGPARKDPATTSEMLAGAGGPDGIIWAGSNFNLYSSRDGGRTWRVKQFDIAQAIRFLLVDPTRPERLYLFFTPT